MNSKFNDIVIPFFMIFFFILFLLALKLDIILILLVLVLMILAVIFFIWRKKGNEFNKILIFVITFLVCFNKTQTSYGLLILLTLIILYLFKYILYESTGETLLRKYELFFWLWIVYALLQTTWIYVSDQTWFYITSLVLGVLIIWISVRLINSENALVSLYKIWGIALFTTIIIGIIEIQTNIHFSGSGAYFYNLQKVATVGFFNPNDYCFFLIVSLPVAFYLLKDKLLYKLLAVIIIIGSFYIIYENQARAMIILHLLIISFFVIDYLIKKKLLLVFIAFFSVILMITFLNWFNLDVNRLTRISSDESFSIRMMLFKNGISLFLNHPFGIGAGNIDYFLGRNSSVSLHNFWLEVLVQYGIIIFISLFIFYFIQLKVLLKGVINNSYLNNLTLPILISSIIFIPACLESSSIFTFNIPWFLFGLMICTTNIIKKYEYNKNH